MLKKKKGRFFSIFCSSEFLLIEFLYIFFGKKSDELFEFPQFLGCDFNFLLKCPFF